MSPSPLFRGRIRALFVASICFIVLALTSLWATSQRATNRSDQPTHPNVSKGLFVPDKGLITPEATITVNSLSDLANSADGLCTLREAITAANSNAASGLGAGECAAGSTTGSDTINIAATGTINLAGVLPNLVSDMSLVGPGSGALTIRRDTGGDYRIFFTSNRAVNFSGMTITNGKTPDGAPGSSGFVEPGGNGGGMMIGGGSSILNDVVITGNRTGKGGDASGGAIAGIGGGGGGITISGGIITMTNCVISNNTTGNGGTVGGGGGSGGPGGGMEIGAGTTISMTNVVVSGNRTGDAGLGPGGASSGANSGAGGGIWSQANVTMTNVTISDNVTGNTSGGNAGAGGGLELFSGSVVTLISSSVKNNRTGSVLSSATARGGLGGGIANEFGTLTVISSSITGNSTGNSGSSAGASGGGIFGTGLTLTNSTISGNSTGTGSSVGAQGGGVSTGSGNITNCTITGNTSSSGVGAGLAGTSSTNVRNTIIANNSGLADVNLANSRGHNLIGKSDGTNGFTNGSNGDQVGTVASPLDPKLGPLTNNGGQTETHALLSTSPAFDAGDNCVTDVAHCSDSSIAQLKNDQRGFIRLVDGPDADTTPTVDIGAYEGPILLANLPDTSTNEDTQLVFGFDPGDTSTITSVTATSSNAMLLPNDAAHLSVVLAGSTGVVTIKPAADFSGTTNITVTVNRTGGSDNKTFLLTVVPVNEAPSFTKGADQTVNEDAGAQTVNNWATNISPGPGDESTQTVTFQVTNNTNAALFSASPAIGATGTLTYTPAVNANGSATITINLKDDGGTANGGADTSASQTFIITVNSVNDAPSFTKGADITVDNFTSQTFNNWATNISVGPSNEIQTRDFQITNNTNPSIFQGGGPAISSTGSLSFIPASNGGGTATITIILKDNGGTANGGVDTSTPQSFNITIVPLGGFISFASAGSNTTESSGSTTFTVNRTGNTTREVTVDYVTNADNGLPCSNASGVASPKCDFTAAFGTLSFGAGETTKTVTVLLSQDSFVEGPETITVTLSNQTANSALAAPATTSISVADDATEPPVNLIDDNRNFVRQHYHDFLNREPDQSGWDFWTNQLTSCGGDVQCNEVRHIDVSASFFLSIEFQQTGYLVERFYKVAYGNANSTSTFGGQHLLAVPIIRANEFLSGTQRIAQGVVVLQPGWEQVLENNKQAFALEFVNTTRFNAGNAYPTSLSPVQFVDKLNTNAGGVLSPSERTAAINLFMGSFNTTNVTARAQAVRMVAEDSDLYNAEFNRAFVLAQYFGYLRRNPNDAPDSDYTGYDFWLTKLNQFNGSYINAEMVKAFLSSIEYRQRFGP